MNYVHHMRIVQISTVATATAVTVRLYIFVKNKRNETNKYTTKRKQYKRMIFSLQWFWHNFVCVCVFHCRRHHCHCQIQASLATAAATFALTPLHIYTQWAILNRLNSKQNDSYNFLLFLYIFWPSCSHAGDENTRAPRTQTHTYTQHSMRMNVLFRSTYCVVHALA